MGYQTTGSITHEATELQAMAQVHQPPNRDNINEEEAAGNVRYKVFERYLGRDTDSMRSAAQPDSVSEEGIELQVMGQVHQPPNLDIDKEDELSNNDSHDV